MWGKDYVSAQSNRCLQMFLNQQVTYSTLISDLTCSPTWSRYSKNIQDPAPPGLALILLVMSQIMLVGSPLLKSTEKIVHFQQ